jgi:hypothetical protein
MLEIGACEYTCRQQRDASTPAYTASERMNLPGVAIDIFDRRAVDEFYTARFHHSGRAGRWVRSGISLDAGSGVDGDESF